MRLQSYKAGACHYNTNKCITLKLSDMDAGMENWSDIDSEVSSVSSEGTDETDDSEESGDESGGEDGSSVGWREVPGL